MAGIADPNTIDVLAQDAEGRYVAVMVEDRSWGADSAQPMQLREKINSYAGFILDGELSHRYPETVGQPVHIQLDCIQEPSGPILAIVHHAQAQLARHDIDLRVNVRA